MAERSASSLDFVPLTMPEGHYDVAVLGGGLAGLSIGLQIKRERPDTRILIAEKRQDPPRDAAFKVGESTVEIGAYYYRDIVGMRDHMEDAQLRKLGLRFYLPADGNKDIAKRVEFCTPAHHTAFTHQLDRGRFERELFDRNVGAGNDAVRGFRVLDVDVGDPHTVKLGYEGGEVEVNARWLVDASGRSNILRNKLGIGTETGHDVNAAWFRLAGGLDFEAWTEDEEWLGRMPERGLRLYSTTHLIDDGYWLWLIQLATGPISIGICADPRFHPFERINSLDAFIDWMHEHEPQLGEEVDRRRKDVLDFLRVENFSYASSQAFSAKDRWTLVGEAFGFIDALYSPGSDFIGYTNTLSSSLIERELDGEDVGELADFYNEFFLRVFNATLALYKDKYQCFGNAQVMVTKFVNDSLTYFTLLGSPFLHGKMREPEDIQRRTELVDEVAPQMERMQQLFIDWNALSRTEQQGISVLSREFKPYIAAQEEMSVPGSEEELIERAREKIGLMRAYAVWVFHMAAASLPEDQRPDESRGINPNAISLQPDRWEADGLYDDENGLTLAQAMERLEGVEEMDLEARGAVAAG